VTERETERERERERERVEGQMDEGKKRKITQRKKKKSMLERKRGRIIKVFFQYDLKIEAKNKL
jgi:hypothetical protein